MGICASIPYNSRNRTITTNGAKVIHAIDGRLQEFRRPITAGNVLSDHDPERFFLCSTEDMYVNCYLPQVPIDEELEPGQIYFVMPVSRACRPISLRELCLLAIKASLVLGESKEGEGEMEKTKMGSGRRKRNGGGRRKEKVDFQVALKKL